uniref:Uncharacterized protein n=1 Tax=Manihot esculenta TaxID=3983 RepID=A0A2C9VQH5_MANES
MACKKVLYLWVILFIFVLALLASAAASRHQIRNARLLVTEKNARMLDADYTPLDDPHGGNYGQRT